MSSTEQRQVVGEQRRVQLDALCRAIDAICDACDLAADSAEARGYPQRVSAAVTSAPLPPNDDPESMSGRYVVGDPTGNAAIRPDVASRWIADARRLLALLLRLSPSVQVNGAFYPPRLRSALKRAAEEVVSIWPRNVALLFQRIHRLANVARREWPPTPEAGTKVGAVVVGQRGDESEVCTECKAPIGANAEDPLARIDGRPYHRRPCYQTVWQRQKRQASRDDRTAQ